MFDVASAAASICEICEVYFDFRLDANAVKG